MRDALPEDEDARLRMLFSEEDAPIPDDGFSDAVLRRIARRQWQRRGVFALAGGCGAWVAAGPLWGFAVRLGREISALVPQLDSLVQHPYALAAGVLLLAAPGVLRWLEE